MAGPPLVAHSQEATRHHISFMRLWLEGWKLGKQPLSWAGGHPTPLGFCCKEETKNGSRVPPEVCLCTLTCGSSPTETAGLRSCLLGGDWEAWSKPGPMNCA